MQMFHQMVSKSARRGDLEGAQKVSYRSSLRTFVYIVLAKRNNL